MEKLKLKHLAGYLPYGLKVRYGTSEIKEVVALFHLLIDDENKYLPIDFCLRDRYIATPILHPLSDLTKSITIDGITFVPNTWIDDNIKTNVEIYKFLNGEISLDIETENYNQTIDLMDGYLIMQKLLEWHFDIYGLIDKGLAIDINTLK
jgi:hypothetical protein